MIRDERVNLRSTTKLKRTGKCYQGLLGKGDPRRMFKLDE